MNIIEELQKDLKTEYETTKKFIDLYPDNKNDWKPHAKSMSFGGLTNHIVDIFRWPAFMMKTDSLDLTDGSQKQPMLETKDQLKEKLKHNFEQSTKMFKNLKPEEFDGRWQLKYDGAVLSDWNKYEAIMQAFKQISHHRAQLGVFYRLNDIPLPGSYGPSADGQ